MEEKKIILSIKEQEYYAVALFMRKKNNCTFPEEKRKKKNSSAHIIFLVSLEALIYMYILKEKLREYSIGFLILRHMFHLILYFCTN